MSFGRTLSTLAAVLMYAQPVAAHHSFAAEFDAGRAVRLRGVLTRVEWSNPHIHFYIDVTDEKGNVVNWYCESGGPNTLTRHGMQKSDLKPGTSIVVEGYAAKNGSPRFDATRLILPDGRMIDRFSPADRSADQN